VLYSSTEPIAGFQFTLTGPELVGIEGGAASDVFGEQLQWSDLGIVIGFSFDLDPNFIPAGEGILTTLSILPYNSPTNVCITDLVVSDATGDSALDFDQGCLPLPCEDLDQDNICDFADDCVSNGDGNLTDGYDCNGVCNGLAFIDDCNVCSEGDTSHAADSDQDCHGDCFGEANWDDCGVCSGGDTGIEANSNKDCNGDCFGEAFLDSCDVCSGGNSDHEEDSDIDCNGDCYHLNIHRNYLEMLHQNNHHYNLYYY
jgi:hypothetical protein